jgi:hypothetical protein
VSESDSDVDSIMVEKNEEIIKEACSIYVLPLFIKPGKHQYMIKLKDSTEKHQRKATKRKLKNEALG